MGYEPCCDGTGDFVHRRDARPRPCTDGWRRNSSGNSRRQKAVGSSSCSTGMGRSFFFCAPCIPWRSGETGERGELPAQEHGAVCADRLAKKRTARASDILIGTINPASITRQSLLRQSEDRKTTAVGLSRSQILELRGCGTTLFSSRVE